MPLSVFSQVQVILSPPFQSVQHQPQPSFLLFSHFPPALDLRYPVPPFVSTLFSPSLLVAQELRFDTYDASFRVHAPRLLFYVKVFLLEAFVCSAWHSAVLRAAVSLTFVTCHEWTLDLSRILESIQELRRTTHLLTDVTTRRLNSQQHSEHFAFTSQSPTSFSNAFW